MMMARANDTAPALLPAIRRGFLGRCPRCARGKLFCRFLEVAEACDMCGTAFHHHRADDVPPYLVIFLVGHIVGYGILKAETGYDVPLWLHFAVWPALAILLALVLLQPVKGVVIALQYALGMHGFAAEAASRRDARDRPEELQRDGRKGAENHGAARYK
jgi:uncharacterized protein (DUF983 family)